MVDNTNLTAKVELRNYFLDNWDYEQPIRIMEAFTGQSRKIYKRAYKDKGLDVTSLDLKGGDGVIKTDNRAFIRDHANDFNFFDFDDYGAPYEQVITLFHNRTSNEPFVLVITDGVARYIGYGHPTKLVSYACRVPLKMKVWGLSSFWNEITQMIYTKITKRYNFKITKAKIITGGNTGKMYYYGFCIERDRS